MTLTTAQARSIALQFLKIFFHLPAGDPGSTPFDWSDMLSNPLVPDKNWLRNLLLIIAQGVADDDTLTVSPYVWNKHIEDLNNGSGRRVETIDQYTAFLKDNL